jgi:hypothetical protein
MPTALRRKALNSAPPSALNGSRAKNKAKLDVKWIAQKTVKRVAQKVVVSVASAVAVDVAAVNAMSGPSRPMARQTVQVQQ